MSFLKERLDPAGRYGLRLTLFAVAVILVALPFALLLDQVVRKGPLLRLDTAAAHQLHTLVRGSPVTIGSMRVLSDIGKPITLYAATAVAVWFLWRRGRTRLIAYVTTTGIIGGVVDTVVKHVVNRDRPSIEDPIVTAMGKSFPSGHTMSSTVVYGALLLAFLPAIPRRRRGWVIGGYLLLITLIGFSRLALGVHFLSDVLGGYVLGFAWLAASTAAFSIWRQERGRPPVHVREGVEPEAARALKRQ